MVESRSIIKIICLFDRLVVQVYIDKSHKLDNVCYDIRGKVHEAARFMKRPAVLKMKGTVSSS